MKQQTNSMKHFTSLIMAVGVIVAATDANAQNILTPDLKDAPLGQGWQGSVAAAKAAQKDAAPAVEFNQPGQNVVWLAGLDFKEGVIEFDAKGKSAPPQSSFVGVAFHLADATNYEAVYFRPFNFRATDPDRKVHAVQYISEPAWPWEKLRKEKTGQFEKPLKPAPDGDAWFHAMIVVQDREVRVFLNGLAQPALVVRELGERTGGWVGLWANGYGAIANLVITSKN